MFVTDQKYKTEDVAEPIRVRLSEQITDIDELGPEADGRSETPRHSRRRDRFRSQLAAGSV